MRTSGRLEHSLVPFFNSHFINSTVWHLSLQISRTKWTVTIVFPNYSKRLTLLVGGSIYDTVASRVDIFLQETTAHDPTTDQRAKRLFCSLACSKLQNSENRENMNPNLKAPSLYTIPLYLFPRVLV